MKTAKRARQLALVTKSPVAVEVPGTRDEKLAAALKYLGDRHVLHPRFDVKKLRVGALTEWRASLPRYRP